MTLQEMEAAILKAAEEEKNLRQIVQGLWNNKSDPQILADALNGVFSDYPWFNAAVRPRKPRGNELAVSYNKKPSVPARTLSCLKFNEFFYIDWDTGKIE